MIARADVEKLGAPHAMEPAGVASDRYGRADRHAPHESG